MKDIIKGVRNWVDEGNNFAIATVVNTWRSSPRPAGSSLIISQDQEMIGSVSGGCVERSVLQKGLEVLTTGIPVLTSFGVSDEDAWEVGLSCGGQIEVFVEEFLAFSPNESDKKVWQALNESLQHKQGAVMITDLTNDGNSHFLVFPDEKLVGSLNDSIVQEGLRCYRERKSQTFEVGDKTYFAQVFPPQERMLIIGSAHITSELIALAKLYDFDTTVIDPRDTFAKKTIYQTHPDRILVKWPQEILEDLVMDEDTYAVILSHDPKIDDEALNILLKKEIPYIGVLGSRRTHEKRLSRLKERGFSEQELQRINAPVGIDIKASLPREIALSIMAEIISVKNRER